MKPRHFAGHAMRCSALFLLLCAGGCITMETQEDIAAQQAQQMALQQTIDRLKAQTESLLAQQEQLQQQIQTLRSIPQDRVTSSDLQAVQSRIAELDRKIAAVDAARSQDMQNVINKVSGLVAAQASRSSTPVRSSTGGSKTSGGTKTGSSHSGGSTQKAYEHIVAAGDTLSAIASAYKVQASSIVGANNLTDPGHLKVGQKLLIPAP